MNCPHCRRGKLVNPTHNVQLNADLYICSVCRRGWHQDKEGKWHSHFAADVEVYSADGKRLLDCSTWHLNEAKP
jgi:transcription elongation factor Elf1